MVVNHPIEHKLLGISLKPFVVIGHSLTPGAVVGHHEWVCNNGLASHGYLRQNMDSFHSTTTIRLPYRSMQCTPHRSNIIPTFNGITASGLTSLPGKYFAMVNACKEDTTTSNAPVKNFQKNAWHKYELWKREYSQIARLMGPTWGPSQVGTMLTPSPLLSGLVHHHCAH